MFKELLKLQDKIFKIATDKGFWEANKSRNHGESVMLMITELSEAVEAHRKDRTVLTKCIPIAIITILNNEWTLSTVKDFETYIKDTVEDEIADTVIRILDYTKGFDIPLYERDYRKERTGNFSTDVLRLIHYHLEAFHHSAGKDWGYVLAAIIKFCEWYEIDLIQHITWKMKYNSTRPFKHGKKY